MKFQTGVWCCALAAYFQGIKKQNKTKQNKRKKETNKEHKMMILRKDMMWRKHNLERDSHVASFPKGKRCQAAEQSLEISGR